MLVRARPDHGSPRCSAFIHRHHALQLAALTSGPGLAAPASVSSSGTELGHPKEDRFDTFMRVMDRLESTLEKLTGSNRDEPNARNADGAWKGPFHF